MANELQYQTASGLTLWGELRSGTAPAQAWNGSAFVTVSAGSPTAAARAITLTDAIGEGTYLGTMPAGAVGQDHRLIVRRQAGGSRELTDTAVAVIDFAGQYWT